MRKSYILLVCIVLLVSGLISSVPAEQSTSNNINFNDPIQPPEGGIVYVNGDWNVTDTREYKNCTIVMNGNLTIENGGNLTFNNVTLKMNGTANASYYIEIQDGGEFYVFDNDNDNTTTYDASVITSSFEDGAHRFLFWVNEGGRMIIKNSEVHEVGNFFDGFFTFGAKIWGLYIYSDDVIIDHSLLSDNYYAIIAYGSSPIISNNTISWNEIGIWSRAWSNATIDNNTINWSKDYGIWVDGVDNSKKWSSNPLIKNNKILYTGRDTFTAVGIQVTWYSHPTIIGNEIINSTEDSIYVGEWSELTVEDTILDADGGNYGIVGSSARNITMINSTILNTALLDAVGGTTYFTFTNTTFNRSKIDFFNANANLTVNWYLNNYINDTNGNPIPNTNIKIMDNANGTFDQNFTTDANGYINWTVLKGYYQTQSTLIDYNPYNITVEKNGYYTNYTVVEMNESRYITITLQADENPIADAGPDQSVNEDETVNFDGSGSTDDVEILWYNWSFGDGSFDNGANITTNHTYTNAGTYVVTLNVTDTIGQWDTDTALIFVNNVGPTADGGSGQVVNEGEIVVFNGSGSTDTDSDKSNLLYTWYFGDGKTDTGISVTHIYEDDGIYTATVTVTDDNGFVDSNITTITVNNVAPTIEPVPSQAVLEDSLFTLKVNATDVPADTLIFSDNTTLFDIDPITGLIEFTPTNEDLGNHSVNVSVMDDDGGVNYTILNITVVNTNDAPVIESISQQSAIEDVEFTLQVDAEDVDAGDVLTYSLTTSPTGMNIDATGLISWTPTNDDVREHTVTVKVEDSIGTFDTETFTIIVSNMNDAPTIVTTTLADANEDVFYMAYIRANDIDAGDSLIYSLDTDLTFLSIDPFNGLIFGTPDNDDVGTHNVVAHVADGDVYVTKILSLTVVNVNDAPVIASSPVLTVDVGIEYVYNAIASDEDNDILTYSLVEGPEGMVINGTEITWTPTNEQQGKTHQVVVEVSDGEVSTTQSFVVLVGEIPEGANVWLPLLLGLVGGLISGVVISWIMNQRKREEDIREIDKE